MVSASAVVITTATMLPGTRLLMRGMTMRIATVSAARMSVARFACAALMMLTHVFSTNDAPVAYTGLTPRKLLIWPQEMMTAMPAVNPTMTGLGMYSMILPSRSAAIARRMTPAINVARMRPGTP